MAGQFNGLNRSQWKILEPLFSSKQSKMGRPAVSYKKVCNSILWILITGARWCDLPKGRQWASRSTAHRRLGHWEATGILDAVLQKLRDCAEAEGLLNFERLSVDGFFFRRQRWR
jgi:transposase